MLNKPDISLVGEEFYLFLVTFLKLYNWKISNNNVKSSISESRLESSFQSFLISDN